MSSNTANSNTVSSNTVSSNTVSSNTVSSNTASSNTASSQIVTLNTIAKSTRWFVIATLSVLGLIVSGSSAAKAQDSQQPLGIVISRTPLQTSHRLDDFQYHAKTDSWSLNPDSSSNAFREDDSRPVKNEPVKNGPLKNGPRKSGPLKSHPDDFIGFDPKIWRQLGEDPIAYFDTARQPEFVNQFVSLSRPSASHQEARIYVRRSGRSTFEFVCRGSQPSSGSRGFEQTAPNIRFCFLAGSMASVWDNSAVTAIDSQVDSVVWTNDQRHIVYARRHGDGHQLIAYSIADDDYSVLVTLPKSPTVPMLFPDATDGIFVVISGTHLRNISMPPAESLSEFESLRQAPLLYRSVDSKILAVREVDKPDRQRSDNRLIDVAEQAPQDLGTFKVRISVPQ